MNTKLTPELLREIRADREATHITLAQIMDKYQLSKGTAFTAIQGLPRIPRKRRTPRALNVRKNPPLTLPNALQVDWQGFSKQQRGRVAEAAVLFKLTLLGFQSYSAVFDGDHTDLVVSHPDMPRLLRVQVKWPKNLDGRLYGRPAVGAYRTEGHSGRKVYTQHELDFLVAYDITENECHLWRFDELEGRQLIVFTDESREAWHKILPTGN